MIEFLTQPRESEGMFLALTAIGGVIGMSIGAILIVFVIIPYLNKRWPL